MNAPRDAGVDAALQALASAKLDDKYTLERGRVYMSGIQALVRLPMLQAARDRAAGLNTAGFISGYRGSPLGGLDQSLWKAKSHLAKQRIVFKAGLNEDLAATAVWGSQQVNLFPKANVDGVFSMWYGKGPGVDRTGDVFKHANSAGSSRYGGVLVVAGDDHAAKSSTLAHQSEHVFNACGIPVLYPSDVQEYIDFGLHGWAMSRYSGLWVALKCVTDVVESSASVDVEPDRVQIRLPDDFTLPPEGLNIRWPDPPLVQEARLVDYKWYAALAYVRANRLDRVVIDSPTARFGIVSAGKAYLDVRQALDDLGLDETLCAQVGIRLYKVGCVWPLEAQGMRAFANGLEEILVVEEKRQVLEYAIKEELYNWREDVRPRVFGKFDENEAGGGEWSVPRGDWLLPPHADLSPAVIARAIARRLSRFELSDTLRASIDARMAVIDARERALAQPHPSAERKPWFCSGCPHNTSTKVPEGSRAIAGIGCHYMTTWMDRSTDTFSQMGGEGVAWIGQSSFCDDGHVFANLGDGTYFHSGLLAIRAAVAAGVNITYKILFNDAVAMTGGQPVDGTLNVPMLSQQLAAEGLSKIVIVSDEPEKYEGVTGLADGVTVHHRKELDAIQRMLRDTAGTTALIYDQTCATEKRRRRKRGSYPDPARRVVINEAVCEGCGDCSVQSNCLSVEPVDTEFGRKRQINQSSCNKDFSCLNGYCPSFVTLEGAQLKKPRAAQLDHDDWPALPEPALPALARPTRLLVAGIGGTGVVTIGALLGMAGHLEARGVSVLDVTGLAQKGGAVMSHIQIAANPSGLFATRIAVGEADVVIGADALVAASDEALSRMRPDTTRVVVNRANAPTAALISDPDWRFPAQAAEDAIAAAARVLDTINANALAVGLLGDAIYANPLLLGFAWQRGWIPLSGAAIRRAIELNDVAVEANLRAFEWGRRAAEAPERVADAIRSQSGADRASGERVVTLHTARSVELLIERHVAALTAYQDARYAARYRERIERVRAAETALGDAGRKAALTEAVARSLHKVMAYKDEYEVARLQADPAFLASLRERFEGDWKPNYHMAPPLFAKKDAQGRPLKQQYGAWMLTAMRMLARCKGLRGTALDPFGRTQERRDERALIADYEALVDELVAGLSLDRLPLAVELAGLPQDVRGYGHIKERNLAQVRTRWQSLLARWRQSPPTSPSLREVA
ncbi:indolepyruvate ferredoxin oxidoreductase family protein [Chitinasiproducens palmae]|uniref:Indolepyruvate ferredoxin oxidoreductase n=1 Tax=Chitinasiproducens palmae TaxID=1770053 RepID=A0A1H2PPP2_9BURK|nr:indolepyruvate ferredoxin oxidoreductase family protein [Chitinasiproducens palmae]SDV48270.1 indolepyruvate ferredoxin oxidoreductase [Chitinasiproducens palmae]